MSLVEASIDGGSRNQPAEPREMQVPSLKVIPPLEGAAIQFLSPVERATMFRDMKLAKELQRKEAAAAATTVSSPKITRDGFNDFRRSSTKLTKRNSPTPTVGKQLAEASIDSKASRVSNTEDCTLVFFHSNEYLLFLAPPRGFATVAAWTAASRATFEILFATPNQNKTTGMVINWFWTVLLIFSLILVLADASLYLLRYKKCVSRTTVARASRLLLLVTFWLVVVRNTLTTVDYWICSGRISHSSRAECFYYIDSRNHYALLFPFLATFPFWHNGVCLLILVAVEFIAGSVYSGQPAEVRLGRYIFVSALCAAFLALYWWREVEVRRRYVLVRRLASIEASKKMKMESLAQTLLSLAAPDQIHALLQGRPLRIESPRCTILVTEIDQYLNFRQQMDPYTAVRLLEELLVDMETLRKCLSLQKLYFRGDVYIIAIGLRESVVEDHSPIVQFASKFPQKALRVSRMYIYPIRARFGFGTGPGACVMYGGRTLARGICGEAFEDAKRHAKLVPANVIEVCPKTLQACPRLNATLTPSAIPTFTVVSRVKDSTPLATASPQSAVAQNFYTTSEANFGTSQLSVQTQTRRSSDDNPPSSADGGGIGFPDMQGSIRVEVGGPTTQPSPFSAVSPNSTESPSPNLVTSGEPPAVSASATTPASTPVRAPAASGSLAKPFIIGIPRQGGDAFSSDDSATGTSCEYTSTGDLNGSSESGQLPPLSPFAQMGESAVLFPATDRRTAATRRAIDRQTTIFAVLFKEFRYRSVAEESKWKDWMVSFGDKTETRKRKSPNNSSAEGVVPFRRWGEGTSSLPVGPVSASFSHVAPPSSNGSSGMMIAESSTIPVGARSSNSQHEPNRSGTVEGHSQSQGIEAEPDRASSSYGQCSEPEEIEKAFHDGLGAKRFPVLRAAVMLTLLVANVGALAASAAYTPASIALHLVAFATIVVGYLGGSIPVEAEEADASGENDTTNPTTPADQAEAANSVTNPFATAAEAATVPPEKAPVTPLGKPQPAGTASRWRFARIHHAYFQSALDIGVVALLVLASAASGPSLLHSSVDHSFTYLYIVAVLTGGLPMQTALSMLFFLWTPLAISAVYTAFSMSIAYGARELVWVIVVALNVGLIALNEGVSIRRSVQYLLAQRANTQLAIAFEKRHHEVLGKLMPQHFVAAVEKRIIAAGRGTAAETMHDVAVLRFTMRPIDLLHLSRCSSHFSDTTASSSGGGHSAHVGLGQRQEEHQTHHADSPPLSESTNLSGEPAGVTVATSLTVLDHLERRIILIEQALVGLETAWFTFWDGDTGEVSGPLHKSQPNFLAMPAVSKALGRQWHEEQGNKAAVELIRFLMRLRKADLWPWKGLLHRRDGLAVVFGLERPTFVLTGAVTEVASEAFNEVVSEGEVVMTEAFLKQFPTELAWKTFGRGGERKADSRGQQDDRSVAEASDGSAAFNRALTNLSAPMAAAAAAGGSNSSVERTKTTQSPSPSLEFNSLLEGSDSGCSDPRTLSVVGLSALRSPNPGGRHPDMTEPRPTPMIDDDPYNPSRSFWNSLGFDLGSMRTARLEKNGFLRVRTLRETQSNSRK